MNRGEQARPDLAKSNQDAIQSYFKAIRQSSMTFIFAQPRSGSTLLLRLAKLACFTHVVGDRPLEFFQQVVRLYRTMMKAEHGQFGSLQEMENNFIFSSEYLDEDIESYQRITAYDCLNLLAPGFQYGIYKTNSLGLGNSFVSEFVEFLRDATSHTNHKLKIVWLMRDHQEILHSFQTSNFPHMDLTIQEPERVLRLLDEQRQQFNDCHELGDIRITYQQILADPIAVLNKLNVSVEPQAHLVEQIMSRKIR